MMRIASICALFMFILIFRTDPIHAYSDSVHIQITTEVIEQNKSKLNSYIQRSGLLKGVDEFVNGNKIQDWIKTGSWMEDRSVDVLTSHFYDPMSNKGYSIAGVEVGQSAYDRANDLQNYGPWVWARKRFFDGLTQTDVSLREKYLGVAFHALGNAMHLVQDMAVPAHTRNDLHLPIADPEPYEIYTNANVDKLPYTQITFSHWNAQVSDMAPKQFWDLEYTGGIPHGGDYAGLAEITNANFMSKDTIFKDYSHPAIGNTEAKLYSVTARDGTTENVWYLSSKNNMYLPDTIAAFKYFKVYLEDLNESYDDGRYHLDDNVHKSYAEKLLPLAVGYSAGLLDYFFRGQIELILPVSGVYAKIDNPELASGGFKKLQVLAKNITPNDEEMTEGSIQLVVKHRIAQGDPFHSNQPAVSPQFYYIVAPEASGAIAIPRNAPILLTFNLEQTPIPLYATDVYIQVVYKGKLGSENGAVAVGFKDISEPTPVDFYNNMDRICLFNKWYTAGTAEAIKQVDPKNTGIPAWDIYKHNIKDLYYGIFPQGSLLVASPTNYTFKTDKLETGNLDRHFVLSDEKFTYTYYLTIEKTTPEDFYEVYYQKNSWIMNAIKNQEERVESQEECAISGKAAPCNLRHSPLFYPFRGIDMWGEAGIMFDNPKYPTNATCDWLDVEN
jgi:hypothetical protein